MSELGSVVWKKHFAKSCFDLSSSNSAPRKTPLSAKWFARW